MQESTTLASGKLFHLHITRSLAYSLIIITFSLCVGVLGYRYVAELSWVDAFLNASMILTGMGPVNPMHTAWAKIFASCYALFSGIVFLTTIAVFISPVLHRFMVTLHMDEEDQQHLKEETRK